MLTVSFSLPPARASSLESTLEESSCLTRHSGKRPPMEGEPK